MQQKQKKAQNDPDSSDKYLLIPTPEHNPVENIL